jgi:P4 family phage/plasmid primase-like protien
MKNTKEITKQLPNIWDLGAIFIKENPHIKYCMSYKTYYFYNNNKKFWAPINNNQLIKIFIKFLKDKYPDLYKKFNLKSIDDIFLLITTHEDFSMPDAIANANSNGFLLPFLNGVLNTKTLELLPHDPMNYSTHIIPIEYNPQDSLVNTKFAEFLTSLVNGNPHRLKILRACLNLIFTNNLLYQIALYIYGPGGTGKSTFINLLIYLLGKDVTLNTSMNQINSRFGLASIIGKYLLILNDVSLYRGQEPKNIKNIVTQDVMEADVKYKPPVSFTPNSFLIVTSNVLWDIKNSTTGLSRRMIYFPFDNIPEKKELDLFKILRNNEAVGALINNLGGFVNWILTCPQENIDLLYKGGSEITSMISQESIYVNPLNVFVKDCLIQNEDMKVKLGSRQFKEKSEFSLYEIYQHWCEANGLNPISFKSFSILILDLLKQQGWKFEKKRTTSGFIIKNVGINWAYLVKAGKVSNVPKEFSHLVNSDEDIDKDLYNNNISLTNITEKDFENNS